MDLAAQAAGIGALADPVRRALYEYVTAQPDAVGREAAAAAVRVPAHTAKFHLDRLCDEGLLVTEYRRLSGKTGPGAGRPAKLYRRADRQFAVSLPERRYELAGHILATAVQRAEGGAGLADALREAAYDEGHRLGEGTSAAGPDLDRLGEALATQGFEPRVEGGVLVLANCPFDKLAKEHTSLVCGLNQWYVQGAADGLGCREVRADLAPAPGQCCIRARLNPAPSPSPELRVPQTETSLISGSAGSSWVIAASSAAVSVISLRGLYTGLSASVSSPVAMATPRALTGNGVVRQRTSSRTTGSAAATLWPRTGSAGWYAVRGSYGSHAVGSPSCGPAAGDYGSTRSAGRARPADRTTPGHSRRPGHGRAKRRTSARAPCR
jgi:predicted ArsR family transcriptional regulator